MELVCVEKLVTVKYTFEELNDFLVILEKAKVSEDPELSALAEKKYPAVEDLVKKARRG